MNINSYIEEISEICGNHEVAILSAFGSVLNDKFNETSDVDFLVTFANNKIEGSFDRYFDLKEALERLLDRRVDLVCENGIRNPYFKEIVDKKKRILYAT